MRSSDAFSGRISLIEQPLGDLIALIALDDDETVLDRAAGTAMRFQLAAELIEVIRRAGESFHKGNGLAGPLTGIQPHAQLLETGKEGLLADRLFFRPEIGVGGIDDA